MSGLNETLPVRVLNFVQGQASPRINAIGSFTFTVSMVLVMTALILVVLRSAIDLEVTVPARRRATRDRNPHSDLGRLEDLRLVPSRR